MQIEQKKRDKARRAASKEEHIKPLFGEDGKRRTMLDKYDEEEDTGMDINEAGAFSSEKAKQQAEIRAKLAAGERVPLPCLSCCSCAANHRSVHAPLFMLMSCQQLAGSSNLVLSSSQLQQMARIWAELRAGTVDCVAPQAGLQWTTALARCTDVRPDIPCVEDVWRAAVSCCC